MTHPISPPLQTGPTFALRPEHNWISDGSTLNPAPGALLKRRRDTADGCRERATADLLQAVTVATASGRKVLEQSAASWNARAELLQTHEMTADVAKRRTGLFVETPSATDIVAMRQAQ